jgi:hypothetical protein
MSLEVIRRFALTQNPFAHNRRALASPSSRERRTQSKTWVCHSGEKGIYGNAGFQHHHKNLNDAQTQSLRNCTDFTE